MSLDSEFYLIFIFMQVLDYELLFYAIYLFYSATMDTHFVPLVKQGYTTGAPLVDRSSEILGV